MPPPGGKGPKTQHAALAASQLGEDLLALDPALLLGDQRRLQQRLELLKTSSDIATRCLLICAARRRGAARRLRRAALPLSPLSPLSPLGREGGVASFSPRLAGRLRVPAWRSEALPSVATHASGHARWSSLQWLWGHAPPPRAADDTCHGRGHLCTCWAHCDFRRSPAPSPSPASSPAAMLASGML